jgi:hypothetical protein
MKMTKQQIIDAVLEWTEKLGHVPSHVELIQLAGVNRKVVRRQFGSYRALLAELKLSGTGSGYQVTLEELFRDWARLARKLKKLPTISEYELHSQYSVRPMVTRFGTWKEAPRGLKQYAEEQGWAEEWKDVMEMVNAREKQEKALRALKSAPGSHNARKARRFAIRSRIDDPKQGPGSAKKTMGRKVYGGLMRPGPMVCEPTNEQGVLFLFGARAEKLGFAVLTVGTAYPDCEAFRIMEGGRLERVRIEFEFESRNFLMHMHEPNKADIIVCWRHNWEECPLEVIELKRAG